MSTHPAPELLQLWVRQDLTIEQAAGHLLQHIVALTKQLAEMEKRLRLLEQAAKTKP